MKHKEANRPIGQKKPTTSGAPASESASAATAGKAEASLLEARGGLGAGAGAGAGASAAATALEELKLQQAQLTAEVEAGTAFERISRSWVELDGDESARARKEFVLLMQAKRLPTDYW